MNILLVGRSGLAQFIWGELVKDKHDVTVLHRGIGFDLAKPRQDLRLYAASLASQQIMKHYDALIIPAGIQGCVGVATQLPEQAWSDALTVNVLGTINSIVLLLPLLRYGPSHAKVICFSGGGSTVSRPFFSPYAISKTAIIRLVECLADEWSQREMSIDINAIAPGQQLTGMTREVIEAGPKLAGQKEYDAAMKTLREPPSSEPMMKLIRWLLSSDSDGVSGNLLAALWDDIAHIKENLERNPVFYKLRRIMP